MTLREREYVPAYDNIESPRSRALIEEVDPILLNYGKKTFPGFKGNKYKRIFRGSVGLDFDMIFEPTANVTSTNILQGFQKANGTEELNFITLGKITAVDVTPTTTPPTPTPTGMLLSWLLLRFHDDPL